jgi:lipopolysaccharide transport system ATP-binding protein
MTAIRVEGISKKYVLGHLARRPGASLREAVTESLRSAGRILALRGRTHGSHLSHEDFWALSDISFEVEKSERVGIIGRNSSGKSTLLKILSRITRPTKGQARIRGRAASLLEVGTGFHWELTGRENIFLNGAILGMSRVEIRKKFDEIVQFSGVERFIDTPVKRYSSGMYVRLAFSVAAHLESDILLVDEVLAVGDAEFQKKCLEKMGNMGREGRTILFVSHNMNAVEQLCTKCILLEKGRLVMHETDVRKVIQEYLSGPGRDGATSSWVNPGEEYRTPWFTPRGLFITDSYGVPLTTSVRNDAELWVQLQVEVHQSDPVLKLGYAIYSEDGFPLYWSYHTDRPEAEWPRLTEGDWVLRGRIPTGMLNEGAYRVELMAELQGMRWLVKPGIGAPEVTFVVEGGLSSSPYWTERRPGVVAPVIAWSAHRVNRVGGNVTSVP